MMLETGIAFAAAAALIGGMLWAMLRQADKKARLEDELERLADVAEKAALARDGAVYDVDGAVRMHEAHRNK